jgi:hypothetical protein
VGAFNTSIGSKVKFGAMPLPDDYNGSGSQQMMEALVKRQFPLGGDKDKAMKVLYEVIIGEGVGKDRQAEHILPLGADIADRLSLVRDQLTHALDIFGHDANNVKVDP